MADHHLASEFSLTVFERQVASIKDVKALRRMVVRLQSTIIHQQMLYEELLFSRKV